MIGSLNGFLVVFVITFNLGYYICAFWLDLVSKLTISIMNMVDMTRSCLKNMMD